MVETPSYPISIFIAGNLTSIEQMCRCVCMDDLCVTITPTTFVYTGGAETGAIVGLINYPRFCATPERLRERAFQLADALIGECCQKSCTVQTPETTYYIKNRELE